MRNHIYNGLVAVQWALVDHKRGDGGFCCVLGSHSRHLLQPSGHPQSWVVEVPMMAGDVLFFTEALTHGTLTWSAPYVRRSLLYKYAPGTRLGHPVPVDARRFRRQRAAQRAPATADADPRRQPAQSRPLTLTRRMSLSLDRSVRLISRRCGRASVSPSFDPLQAEAALEQRHQLAVTALEDADPADRAAAAPTARRSGGSPRTARRRPRSDVELDVQPIGEHVELELSDRRQNRVAVAHQRVAQDLDHALFVELGEPAAGTA